MSTRLGTSLHGRFRPRMVIALVKVAMIGTWRGHTFLDDDRDLSDVAEFSPTDSVQPVLVSRAADSGHGAPDSVAA